jgi:rubredoxin
MLNSLKGSPVLDREPQSLSYHDTFLCPICRHGQIAGITLMDAFACNFCRHIFTANLTHQSVQVVDSSQPMTWRWNGRGWQSAYRDDPSLTMIVGIVAIVLTTLPASIVWLCSYVFPPLPGSIWAWFPSVWVGCTFGIHVLMVGWIAAEHYQFPLYVANRIRLRQLLGRR